MSPGFPIGVRPAAPDELAGPLAFLEELGGSEPVPASFVQQLRRAVEKGDLEVLVARAEPDVSVVGVAVLAFRLSVLAGSSFASIEDLYVGTGARRRGVGRTLLDAVGERCRARGVSYIEVQTDDEAASFYEAFGYEPEEGVQVLSRSHAFS